MLGSKGSTIRQLLRTPHIILADTMVGNSRRQIERIPGFEHPRLAWFGSTAEGRAAVIGNARSKRQDAMEHTCRSLDLPYRMHAPSKISPTLQSVFHSGTNRARTRAYQHHIRQAGRQTGCKQEVSVECSIIPCPLIHSFHGSSVIPSILFCPWSQRFTCCDLTLGTSYIKHVVRLYYPGAPQTVLSCTTATVERIILDHALRVRTVSEYITWCLLCSAGPQGRGHINLVSRFTARSIYFEATEPCGQMQITYN